MGSLSAVKGGKLMSGRCQGFVCGGGCACVCVYVRVEYVAAYVSVLVVV